MVRVSILAVLLAFAALPAVSRADEPGEVLTRLAKRYDDLEQAFSQALRAAKTKEENSAANKLHQAEKDRWLDEALAAIRKHPAEPATFGVIEKFFDGADT